MDTRIGPTSVPCTNTFLLRTPVVCMVGNTRHISSSTPRVRISDCRVTVALAHGTSPDGIERIFDLSRVTAILYHSTSVHKSTRFPLP